MKLEKIIALLGIWPAGLAIGSSNSEISVRQLSPIEFQLTITVESKLDLAQAQQDLLPTAQSICAPLGVLFGHYAFDSNEQISGGPPRPSNLFLKQEISCGPASTAGRPMHQSYEWSPSAMDNANIERMTYDYLAEKDANMLKAAYDRFSESMKAAARFESWSKNVEEFNSKAGPAEFTKVRRISWTKDPPGVDPGFYAAVDYARRFKNIPFQCGYAAWYRDANGRLSIVREEQNSIDQATKQRMTGEEIAAALAQFGCAP